MGFREKLPQRREKWPLEFDLTGIERDNHIREQLLQNGAQNMPKNNFGDQSLIDLSKPPRVPYNYREYPKLLYRGKETKQVEDAAGEKAANELGFGSAHQAVATDAAADPTPQTNPNPPVDEFSTGEGLPSAADLDAVSAETQAAADTAKPAEAPPVQWPVKGRKR